MYALFGLSDSSLSFPFHISHVALLRDWAPAHTHVFSHDVWRQRLGFRQVLRGLRWLRGFRWRDLFDLIGPSPLRAEIKQWNSASFILTNDEKLVARYILRVQDDAGRLPPSSEIREALHLDETKTHTALRMLQRLSFLILNGDNQYDLALGHRTFLQGLGFSFHTVTLQDHEQFNVP